MVEIVCPVTKKGVIAGYVVGGVVGRSPSIVSAPILVLI